MGCWGTGAFQNDGAGDFVDHVIHDGGLPALESTIDSLVQVGLGYPEAPMAEETLAAAAILILLKNRDANVGPIPESLHNWLAETNLHPNDSLLAKARKAAQRILAEPSELLELWSEVG